MSLSLPKGLKRKEFSFGEVSFEDNLAIEWIEVFLGILFPSKKKCSSKCSYILLRDHFYS